MARDIYVEANTKTKRIPVFAVITKVDKCELSRAMVKDIEEMICSTFCISSNHVLLCNNYQYNLIPEIEEDITILEFLNKLCDPTLKTVEFKKIDVTGPPAVPEHPANNTFLWKTVLIGIIGLMFSFTLSLIYNFIYSILT